MFFVVFSLWFLTTLGQLPASEKAALCDFAAAIQGLPPFFNCSDVDNACSWPRVGLAQENGYGVNCNFDSTSVIEIIFTNGTGLTGFIPNTVNALTSLNILALSNNSLTGTIPTTLGTLSSLSYLLLKNNQLSGTVPPQLVNILSLRFVDIDGNLQLGGQLPAMSLVTLTITPDRFCGSNALVNVSLTRDGSGNLVTSLVSCPACATTGCGVGLGFCIGPGFTCPTSPQPSPQPTPQPSPQPPTPQPSPQPAFPVPNLEPIPSEFGNVDLSDDALDTSFTCDDYCYDPTDISLQIRDFDYTCNQRCLATECAYRGLYDQACAESPVYCDTANKCPLELLFNGRPDFDCLVPSCRWDGYVPYSRVENGVPVYYDKILKEYETCTSVRQEIVDGTCVTSTCPIMQAVCQRSDCITKTSAGGVCQVNATTPRARTLAICADTNTDCAPCKDLFKRFCPATPSATKGKGKGASTAPITTAEEECAPGCKNSMVGNDRCDEECMTFNCRFDYPDCPGKACTPGDATTGGSGPAFWYAQHSYYVGPFVSCDSSSLYTPSKYTTSGNPTLQASGPDNCYWDYFPGSDGVDLVTGYWVNTTSRRVYVVWANVTDYRDAFDISTYTGLAPYFDVANCRAGAGQPKSVVDEKDFPFSDGTCQVLGVGVDPTIPFNLGLAVQIFLSATTNFAPRPCLWGEVGNGICEDRCNIPSCFNDFTDCDPSATLQVQNLLYCDCPSSSIADGVCDPDCNNQYCAFDGGDCWCNIDCPTELLYDGKCDAACNVDSCYRDFKDCLCAVGCDAYLIGDKICQDACNTEACGYDAGDCVGQGEDEMTYSERSLYTALIFPQQWPEDDCPDIVDSNAPRQVYDFGEYKRDKVARPEIKFKSGWESTGEPKYFDRCYSSYRYGHFKATYVAGSDRSQATFFFDCDATCDEDSCLSVSIEEQDKCVSTEDADRNRPYTVKMKWENSSGVLSFSVLLLLSLICTLLF